jgi:large subunit ribosomal protein L30
MDNTVKVTLMKSLYGQLASIRGSVRGLGLRRIGHSVVVADTPSNRGMMNAASHMLRVEPAAKPAASEMKVEPAVERSASEMKVEPAVEPSASEKRS